MNINDKIIQELKEKKYGDANSIEESTKENLVLQQEKLSLKYDFICSERNRLFYEHLDKDRSTWPTVADAAAKLSAGRKEKNRVKGEYEEEKEKIGETLQTVSEEYEELQAKVKTLEEKIEVFKTKKAGFESQRNLDPAVADIAIQKCRDAVTRLQSEVAQQNVTLAELERSLADLRVMKKERISTTSVSEVEDMVERAKKILAFLESTHGLRVSSASDNEISFEMTRTPPGERQEDENFLLQLTLSFRSGCHGDTQLIGVKINIDHFNIKDLVDVAIATNDVPYLMMSVQERWMSHSPLLSELDMLNKHHVIDWIQEERRLRLLVGNCGKVMFTLQVPQGYPNTKGITLIDVNGADDVHSAQLPGEDSTLLDWVIHLEKMYGHIS